MRVSLSAHVLHVVTFPAAVSASAR
jgi:hypothetical protein